MTYPTDAAIQSRLKSLMESWDTDITPSRRWWRFEFPAETRPCQAWSPEPPATSPLARHFSKIFFTCWCASSSACLGVIRSVAAFANIVGSTNVSNTSLSAGLAGPGCPMFVAHWRAVLIGLSLDGGFEPNGSFEVTCSSQRAPASGFCASGTLASATDPGKEGKL